MENAINKLFSNLHELLQKSLDALKIGKTIEASSLTSLASGTISFPFQLDSTGHYVYTTSQAGLGHTLKCSGLILNPDATYAVTITSSAGGGGSWTKLTAGDAFPFSIKTSFFGKTTITVDIQASVTNQSGSGQISYTY